MLTFLILIMRIKKRLENDAEIGIPYLRPTKTLYYDTERMMRSSGVKWLQYCLNQYGGFHLTVDGKFGAGTQKALCNFRTAKFNSDWQFVIKNW